MAEMRKIALVMLCAWLTPSAILADVRLPRLISDHMVLQQGQPVRIWGQASPGEQVRVGLAGLERGARANDQGYWEVFLPPLQPGGPHTLVITANNTIQIRDVLIGEVWVASGQSNMEWPLERVNNAEHEIAAASFPQIRLFKVPHTTADQPRDDVESQWEICSPATVRTFSAVAYFFARHLHQHLKVPVGIIQSTWGGTPAQAWTSLRALRVDVGLHYYLDRWDRILEDYPSAYLRYQQRLKEWEQKAQEATARGQQPPNKPAPPMGPGHPHAPATLYNGMIAPLTRYAIRGAIWYQGESNAGNSEDAFLYRRLFQTMISDWRSRWNQGPFPFLFVQLANYARVSEQSDWPLLRESQSMALELRNTAMAVTIDIGDPQDIHPRNKQDVGLRLALAARAIAYGEQLTYSGPIYRQVTRDGSRLRIWFDHVGKGLRTRDGHPPVGFLIAGADGVFVPARAAIDGDTVVVWSEQVSDPVAVRYAWAADPENNLQNSEGLPASPFRTDHWWNPVLPRPERKD